MSSGSQNGTTVGGLQGMVIRDASDVVTQSRLRLMFTTNNSANSGYSGSNAYRSKGNQNSYDFLLQVQRGLREWNGGLVSNGTLSNVGMGNGITFTSGAIRTIPPNASASAANITISNTIPVPN
jgi:hypothetical protein